MNLSPWASAAFALTAAASQTLRNAVQHDLVQHIGPRNATFVRFLFGFPFALGFLALACLAANALPPTPSPTALFYLVFASATQVFATALMLLAMRDNSFVVATALIKTEAVQIVAFGMVFLGDSATLALLVGVTLATLGVFVLAFPRMTMFVRDDARSNWRAAGYGLASAAAFGLSTVAFRAGVLALGGASFVVAAAEELALALTLQTLAILCWLAFADRAGLAAIAREWRSSLSAGFLGAFATQFWFLALALESAARVRTLGLAEVIFAQLVTHRFFAQRTSAREALGIVLILAGVALALNGG
jgi:drug/metabolite transporter (DMT)-like permease